MAGTKPGLRSGFLNPVICLSIILQMVLLCAGTRASSANSPAWGAYLATVNDNFTRTREKGKEGFYIGPDDFLSVSLLSGVQWKKNRFQITTHVVTSRKFQFRYDLIRTAYLREHSIGFVENQFGGELWYRGHLAGEWIQNRFHELADLPGVDIPYRGDGIAVAMLWNGTYVIPWYTSITTGSEIRVSTGIVPTRIGLDISWARKFWWIKPEATGGFRAYLNEVSLYSELIRSGFFGGVRLTAFLPRSFELALGMIYFPTENLQNDPYYKTRPHRYSPQIYTSFSFNHSGISLRELMEYF